MSVRGLVDGFLRNATLLCAACAVVGVWFAFDQANWGALIWCINAAVLAVSLWFCERRLRKYQGVLAALFTADRIVATFGNRQVIWTAKDAPHDLGKPI